MSDDAVELSIEDHVAQITLNEPDRRNALSPAIGNGILEAFEEIETAPVRCVTIAGAGSAFSAGGDIEGMHERFETDRPVDEEVRELERTTNEVIRRVVTCDRPTVALVDGPAVGAGANLAIACDIQLGSDRAAMGFVFRQVGLSIDVGTSYLLPRIVGENVAKELVFTGEIVDAERARDLGLLNHVYPTEDFETEAGALVERIASGPPIALRHAKRLLGEGLGKSLEQALTDEAVAQGLVLETDDHEEGVTAFLEDREPTYEGR